MPPLQTLERGNINDKVHGASCIGLSIFKLTIQVSATLSQSSRIHMPTYFFSFFLQLMSWDLKRFFILPACVFPPLTRLSLSISRKSFRKMNVYYSFTNIFSARKRKIEYFFVLPLGFTSSTETKDRKMRVSHLVRHRRFLSFLNKLIQLVNQLMKLEFLQIPLVCRTYGNSFQH